MVIIVMSVLKDTIINNLIVFSVVYYAYHVKMLVINVINVDKKIGGLCKSC